MGYEYRLKFDPVVVTDLDGLLRSVRGFRGVSVSSGAYEFDSGSAPGASEMPSLEARVESGGLYVCDYGDGGPILEGIMKLLSRCCPDVEIEDCE